MEQERVRLCIWEGKIREVKMSLGKSENGSMGGGVR